MPVTTTSFETTDLNHACHLMESAYADGRLRISADHVDGLRLAQARVDCGPVYLDSLTNTLPLDFEVKLEGVVMLGRMLDGVQEVRHGHTTFTAGRGDVYAATTHRPYRSITTNPTVTLVGIDLPLLADLAGQSVEDLAPRLEHQLVDPIHARAWNATVSAVLDHLSAPTPEPHPELVVSSINRVLAAAMLATLLPDPRPQPQDEADVRPETVRRAVAFIESNPDIPLTVVDIARASNVTPRAAQLAFRRHLGTTPTAYLRRVRLEQARDDLLQADLADGNTVTTVAARWGFDNLDRFNHHYKQTFGEPPSTTLQR